MRWRWPRAVHRYREHEPAKPPTHSRHNRNNNLQKWHSLRPPPPRRTKLADDRNDRPTPMCFVRSSHSVRSEPYVCSPIVFSRSISFTGCQGGDLGTAMPATAQNSMGKTAMEGPTAVVEDFSDRSVCLDDPTACTPRLALNHHPQLTASRVHWQTWTQKVLGAVFRDSCIPPASPPSHHNTSSASRSDTPAFNK